MTAICNLLCVGRAGGLITRCWTNLSVIGEAGSVKRTGEKCQKTTPIALIIGIVLVDISIYSLDVLVFVSITYSSWLGGPKSG